VLVISKIANRTGAMMKL